MAQAFIHGFLVRGRRKNNNKRYFTMLRYWHRHLLKPTDIPETPDPALKLELYRKYGHPYKTTAAALEAHIACRTMAAAVKISKWTSLPMKLCCLICCLFTTVLIVFLVGAMVAGMAVCGYAIVKVGYSLLAFLYKLEMKTWKANLSDRIEDISKLPNCMLYYLYLADGEDLRSLCNMQLDGSTVAACVWDLLYNAVFFILVCFGWFGLFCTIEGVYEKVKSKVKELYNTWGPGEVCGICYSNKRTQYFQPCGHLVCCADCSDEVLQCPVCMRFIESERTTRPVTMHEERDASKASPAGSPCKVCGAENREISQRLLVPCGHLVVCKDGCARLLDDCPVCWEEVTDDRNVYLP